MFGVLFFCQFIFLSRSAIRYLNNVGCNAYVDYVQTDPLNYFRYNPFYVKLYRCHGADSLVNPRNKQCLPTSVGIQELDIYVINNSNGSYQVMKVKNHTDCIETCTLDESTCSPYQKFSKDECVCMCQYDRIPNPNPCKYPFYWDSSMCNCICSINNRKCERRKEFSREECGCVCKQKFHVRCAKRKMVVDDKTCGCIEPTVTEQSTSGNCTGDITAEMFVMAMVLEAIFIVVMYFVLYVHCYKRVYFRMKSDKERESITKYEGYSLDNTAQSRSIMNIDDEVPPFTMNSLNRNSLNRNSLNRNSLNRNSLHKNSLRRNSLDMCRNNNCQPKLENDYETNNGHIINDTADNNFYPHDERSQLNVPHDTDSYLYNDIEPTNYDSDLSGSDYYKNISLV